MFHRSKVPFQNALVALGLLVAGVQLKAERVDFTKEVAPILLSKCVSCHGEEKEKGGYRLDSPGHLMTAGDSDERPVLPGNADASLLYELIVSDDEDDRMPQEADPLSVDEKAAFARWIEEGASFGGITSGTAFAEIVVATYPDAPLIYDVPIPVTAIAWLNGGDQLAVGGYHEVIVAAAESGQPVRRIGGLPQRLHQLIPNRGGERLFYAGGQPGRGGEAGVISLDSGEDRLVMARSRDVILAADLSADGKLLAVGGADKQIRIIETDSNLERLRLTQHSDWVMSLAFFPDNPRFVSGGRDKTARVFDLRSGELITTFRGHDAAVFAVTVLPGGETVISGGADGSVRVWDAKSGNEKKRIGGFDGGAMKLGLIGDRLVVAAGDGSASVVLVEGWMRDRTLKTPVSEVAALAIERETGRVAMGDLSGTAGLWSVGDDAEPSVINLLP